MENQIPHRHKVDLAWAAGFYDGEGHCHWHHKERKGRQYGYIGISIAQVEKQPLEKFLGIVQVGKIYGPYGGRSKNNPTPYYVYCTNSEKAEIVLDLLSPYLCYPKKKQAQEVFDKLDEYRKQPRLRKSKKIPAHRPEFG